MRDDERGLPRQNRVDPFGDLIAVPARGLFMGNRGCLHDDSGTIRRYAAGTRWIICELEYKGQRRTLMRPGQYTELFFLDEATAFAAGHRPCALCRRPDFERYRSAWARGYECDRPSASEIDERLDAERASAGYRWAFYMEPAELPTGTMVDLDGRPHLVHNGTLVRWTPEGYRDRIEQLPNRRLPVLTPWPSIVAFSEGYEPVIHPSVYEAAVVSEPIFERVSADDIGLIPMRDRRLIDPPDEAWQAGEVAALSLGYRAANMDEKWCACMEGWTLRITRSWTGIETFVAQFEPLTAPPTMFFGTTGFSEPEGWSPARIVRLWANPDQFDVEDERWQGKARGYFDVAVRQAILGQYST